MSFNRLKVTEKSTKYFALIKGRTGLTPNIISRMALCLSISDSSIPDPRLDDEKGQEFNRYTLLGEWDSFFIALLKERLIHDGLDPDKDLMAQLLGSQRRKNVYPPLFISWLYVCISIDHKLDKEKRDE